MRRLLPVNLTPSIQPRRPNDLAGSVSLNEGKLKPGRNDEGASWNDFGSSGHLRGTSTVLVRNEFGRASELSNRNECGRPSRCPDLERPAVPLSHVPNQFSDLN